MDIVKAVVFHSLPISIVMCILVNDYVCEVFWQASNVCNKAKMDRGSTRIVFNKAHHAEHG